jgi:putative zinc finger protein/fervidolysin-like protein
MRMRLFRFDDPAHAQAAELLPWHANGTLDPLERGRVERHVAECVACRRDLAELVRVQEIVKADADLDLAMPDSLQRMHALLDAGRRRRRTDVGGMKNRWARLPLWARVALPVQAATMLLLVALVIAGRSTEPTYYRLLGAAPTLAPAADRIVVVFAPGTTEQTMRQTLLRIAARVVDGPNAAGAYTLQLPSRTQDAALALLRARSDVLFAEPTPLPQVRRP